MFARIQKLLFPDYCLSCREEVESYGLCGKCFKQIKFISTNCCKFCSHPFPYNDSFEKICAACLVDPPIFDKNLSAIEYNDMARNLIIKFKYQDQQILKKYFINVMGYKAREIIEESDIICPVPMHWFKVLMRNYNQACILAKYISQNWQKDYIPDLLLKIKYTKPQVSLSGSARKKNISGSIKFNQKFDIKNKVILLIDDVFTTGSTLNECAKQLKKNGCKKVYTLTVARKTTF